MIKCWISQRLLDNYIKLDENDNPSSEGRVSEHTVTSLSILNSFIVESDNFSEDFLVQSKGDNILYFFDEIYGGCTSSTRRKAVYSLLDYL